MKPKFLILSLLLIALAAAGGFVAARKFPAATAPAAQTSERKIRFYQSPMHPWIKSPVPGNCTICGMNLTPVYEGEAGFDSAAPNVVALGSNSVQVLRVATTEVARRPLTRVLRVAGALEADETRRRVVSAYVSGRIDRLEVNFSGAEVVEGQPLATIYSPELLTAEREYVTLLRQSAAPNSAGHSQENPRLAAAAKERLKRLGLSADQIRELEHKTDFENHSILRAPISGTVVERLVFEGQYVREGDPLFEIADFSTMWFEFNVYERDLAWIRPGQKVEVTSPALPGRTLTAPITFINPNIDPETRSAKVRVELPNPLIQTETGPRRELFRQLYAEGALRIESPPSLVVPRSAVLAPGPNPVAYVQLSPGNYQQRRLKLGRASDAFWEILSGLEEGEQVVTSGNLLIDAQAQLNQISHPTPPHSHDPAEQTTDSSPLPSSPPAAPAAPHVHPPGPATAAHTLSEAGETAVRDFFQIADALGNKLAGDDLPSFNSELAKLPAALRVLASHFQNEPSWPAFFNEPAAASPAQRPGDLASARKWFHPFSTAAVDFAKSLRGRNFPLDQVRVFRCPMVNQSFPGAPKTGWWIQTTPALRNPYFGAEMLDCGVEVKP